MASIFLLNKLILTFLQKKNFITISALAELDSAETLKQLIHISRTNDIDFSTEFFSELWCWFLQNTKFHHFWQKQITFLQKRNQNSAHYKASSIFSSIFLQNQISFLQKRNQISADYKASSIFSSIFLQNQITFLQKSK